MTLSWGLLVPLDNVHVHGRDSNRELSLERYCWEVSFRRKVSRFQTFPFLLQIWEGIFKTKPREICCLAASHLWCSFWQFPVGWACVDGAHRRRMQSPSTTQGGPQLRWHFWRWCSFFPKVAYVMLIFCKVIKTRDGSSLMGKMISPWNFLWLYNYMLYSQIEQIGNRYVQYLGAQKCFFVSSIQKASSRFWVRLLPTSLCFAFLAEREGARRLWGYLQTPSRWGAI